MQTFTRRELGDIAEMEEEGEEDAYEPPKARQSKQKRSHDTALSAAGISSASARTSPRHAKDRLAADEEDEEAERQTKRPRMKHWTQQEGPLTRGFAKQREIAGSQRQSTAEKSSKKPRPAEKQAQQGQREARKKSTQPEGAIPAVPEWMNDAQTPPAMLSKPSFRRSLPTAEVPVRNTAVLSGAFQLPTLSNVPSTLSTQPTRTQHLAQMHQQLLMPGAATSSQSVAVGPVAAHRKPRHGQSTQIAGSFNSRASQHLPPHRQQSRYMTTQEAGPSGSTQSHEPDRQYNKRNRHHSPDPSPFPEQSPSPHERVPQPKFRKSILRPSQSLVASLARNHRSPENNRYNPYPKPISPSRHSSSKRDRRNKDDERREQAKLSVQAKYAASARRGGRLPTDIDAFGYQEEEGYDAMEEEPEEWSTIQMIDQLKSGARVRGKDITISAESDNIPSAYKSFQPRFTPKIPKEIKTSQTFSLPKPKEGTQAQPSKTHNARFLFNPGVISSTTQSVTAAGSKLTLFKPKSIVKDQETLFKPRSFAEYQAEQQERATSRQRAAALADMEQFSISKQIVRRREPEEAANIEPVKFSLYRTSRLDSSHDAAESSGTEHDTSFDSSTNANRSDTPPTSPLTPMQAEASYYPNRLESRRARDLAEEAMLVDREEVSQEDAVSEYYSKVRKNYQQDVKDNQDMQELRELQEDTPASPPVPEAQTQKKGGWRLPFFG